MAEARGAGTDLTSAGAAAMPDAVEADAMTGNPATDYAIALLSEFARSGVREFVVCPGSRSQALALVAAELARANAVELRVRLDERGAAFLALGTAVETDAPAVVITTSGTAAANLHPAILEAHHSNVPLIVVTSDRPAELRGIRSNQTTIQPGMFGPAVRLMADIAAPGGAPGEIHDARRLAREAVDAALGTSTLEPGPVQIDLALREPLSVAVPDLSALADEVRATRAARGARLSDPSPARAGTANDRLDRPLDRTEHVLRPGLRTVVIAGSAAGPDAEALAREGGWPLIAEISSGARFGPNTIVAYRELLDHPDFGGAIERAIVFGHPTLSRQVPALLGRDGVEVIVVARVGAEVYNPRHRASIVARSARVSPDVDPSSREARAWVGRWVAASRSIVDKRTNGVPADESARFAPVPKSERVAVAREALAELRVPVNREMLVTSIWRYTWPHDRLVLGASRLIRDADRIVPGKKIRVLSNRGLAGIDGTVSTAIGVALASRRLAEETGGVSGITRVLLGDLTLLHDAGSLLIGSGEARPHLQLVVGNDGGGTIFDSLEVAQTADRAALDRVMFTPQNVDFSALAAAYGWSYSRAVTRGELDAALSSPPAGPSILEVPIAR
jgi:2-succinyl-5-enolpyruvyl-6-hydroxy-3-cyclohexene-1-carboxylate synthase